MTDQNNQQRNGTNEEVKEQLRTFTEEIQVAGGQLVDRVQSLVQEGNIRRLIIRDQHGRTLIEVPLTLGVVAGTYVALALPFLAAIGTIAALVARLNIIVERYENPADAIKDKVNDTIAEVTNRLEGDGQ
jgi:phage-related minor tail protein